MSLQPSGIIKISEINTFFGAPNATPLSSYLNRGGNYSAYYDPSNIAIPSSGPISMSNFYSARKNYFYFNSVAASVLGGYNIGPWGASPPGGDTTAYWLWNSPGAAANAPIGPWIHFYKLFTATSTYVGTIYTSVDNDGYVFLNGKLVSYTDMGGWGGTGTSATATINQGTNLLDIYCYNQGGPAGVIAALYNGSSFVLHTDSTWSCYTTSINALQCHVIFGCRRINPFYTGAVFNIRRSSDGATADFYTDFMQSYVATSTSGGTTLSTWLNGATGYIVKWYDQSGNGNHATNNSNNATQPNITLQNGRWIIQFQNANSTVLNITGIRPNTIFCHYYNNNSDFGTIITTAYDYEQRFGAGIYILGAQAGGNAADWYYQGTLNGGACLSYNNGVSSSTVGLSSWNYLSLSVTTPQWSTSQTGYVSSSFNRIGQDGYSSTRSMNGYMTEMICHNTPMTATDMTNFYNNRFF